MHELDSSTDLTEVELRCGLLQSYPWLDGIEQVAARGVVLYHHVGAVRLESGIVCPDDVGVFREALGVLE